MTIYDGTRGSWKVIFWQKWDNMGISHYPKGHWRASSMTWAKSAETREISPSFCGRPRVQEGERINKTIDVQDHKIWTWLPCTFKVADREPGQLRSSNGHHSNCHIKCHLLTSPTVLRSAWFANGDLKRTPQNRVLRWRGSAWIAWEISIEWINDLWDNWRYH